MAAEILREALDLVFFKPTMRPDLPIFALSS
jgi:hypothetical protein